MFGWARGVTIASAVVVLSALLGPSAARAQVQPDAALRLEQLLHVQRDRGETARLVGGVVEVSVGLAAGGVGAYAFADGKVDAERALGIATLSLGVLIAAFGAVVLAVDTTPEDRWQRWLAVRARGVSPYDVAEFVGELRAEARRAQLERSIAIAAGLAVLCTGATTTAFAISLVDEGFRTTFEATGIALGVAGIAVSLLAWVIEPDNVRELRVYERGGRPTPSPPRPQVTPLVGPGTAGLAVAGSF